MRSRDIGPHQPCQSVFADMSRTVAVPQSRQKGPCTLSERIIRTMPWWPRTVACAAGWAPHSRQPWPPCCGAWWPG
ncbi:hypothetical protein ACFWHQ_04695 [Streptomyces sp. NPDC060334]|uniref:hypothetical protein n=1 Tax=Streptomyces sp. NPDC060334 TaxID=3347099 RepID=UPI0036558949